MSVSIVLRPVNAEGRPLPTHTYSWLSLLAALALRETLLETAGIPAELKWPNDVLVRGRKIAGILAQMGPMGDGSVPAVVLGHRPERDVDRGRTAGAHGHLRARLRAPLTDGPDPLLKSYLSHFRHAVPQFLQCRRRPRRRVGRRALACTSASSR